MNKGHNEAFELAGIIENKMRDDTYMFSDVAAIDAADEILNLGYHKIVWHRVAEGDLPPEHTFVRCVLEYCGIIYYSKGIYTEDYGWTFTENENGNARVIAWIELPEYKVQKNNTQKEQWCIGNSLEPRSILLDVQKLIFKNNTLDFEIDVKGPIFDNIDNITINGVKFIKEKNNERYNI